MSILHGPPTAAAWLEVYIKPCQHVIFLQGSSDQSTQESN